MGQVEADFVTFEILLISAQDRCIVCAESTMGMEIILAVPDGTPGHVGQGEARFSPFEIVLVSTQDRCTV